MNWRVGGGRTRKGLEEYLKEAAGTEGSVRKEEIQVQNKVSGKGQSTKESIEQ